MARTLHERVTQALQDRETWEERQRVFYALRRDGLRRRNKPFKGAADLNLPIADNAVEKLKPYYINGIFGRQQLASFTPLRRQLGEASAQAAECLDWKLRKESNYPRQTAHLIDLALVCGRGILKVRWDAELKRLAFDAIDPLFFVMPKGASEIDEADFFCHIKQLTVAEYQRDGRYTQDEELIRRIRGGDHQVEFTKTSEKEHREGLTYSKDEDQIVLWEVYEKVKDGWRVRTYAPTAKETPVREPFLLGYKWQGRPWQPFVSLTCEITDKGWYAPRGVVEKVAPYQTYGTKIWNSKADWLEYCGKPLFTQDVNTGAGTNKENVRLAPGEVLPPGMTPAAVPEPPFALDNEIAGVRQLAEESAGSPDFGIQSAEAGEDSRKSRTATEWNYLGSFAGQGIQYKAWISALTEGEIYWRAWALLVQFNGEELAWVAAGERKVLQKQAVHDQYLIEPDSQPDAWDKAKRMQRAVGRWQMFRGDPDIDQIELKRSVLEADDPRLVKKLLIGQGIRAGQEMEDEAIEITILEKGWPAVVEPGEDHALRIKVLAGYLQMKTLRWQQGLEQPDPMAIQRLQEHLAQHVLYLKEQNPAAARQFIAAIGMVDPSGAGGAPGAEMGGTETLSGLPGGGSPGTAMGGGLPALRDGGQAPLLTSGGPG